jgi:hypothetical protein
MSLVASVSLIICTLMGNGSDIVVYRGYAAHYNYGVMERVLAYRGITVEDGFWPVASPYHKIGTKLKGQSVLTGEVRLFEVTDVAADQDRDRIIARGISIELGWDDQLMWDMCRLSYPNEDRPSACPVVVQVLN